MYDPLGLSIGTGNLVAIRNGSSPVTRRSVLTLFPHRSPEIGLPEENSTLTESGAVTTGFVDCIGDATASLCPGDSPQDPELLLVEALDAMVSAAGGDAASSKLTIAVPAHWGPDALRSLRKGLRTHSGFVRSGIAPRLVSDALAALTAIDSASGLPDKGVVGLLDFGAGGTSITLADAASEFEPIDKTLRYPEFSGNQIDEAVLVHVADATGQQRTLDSATTAAVGPLAQLREQCRKAKERLSTELVTDVVVDSSNDRLSVQLTRAELEDLITDRLDGVLSAFDEVLAQHKIESRDLAAVVTVGGGASIPFVAQRLSSHTHLPVITAVQPAFSAAVGAALFASREPAVVEETTAATAMAAAFSGTTTGISGLPPADLLLDDEPPSAPRKLAWSEDDGSSMEPVPYAGDIYGGGTGVRPARYGPDHEPPEEEPRGRYHVPRMILGLTALAAMVAIGGVAYNLTSAVEPRPPAPPSSPTMAPPAPPATSVAPSPSLLPPPPSVLPSASSPEPPPPPPSAEPPPPPPEPPPAPPPPVVTVYQPAPPPKATQPATTAPPTTTATTTTTPSEPPPPDTPADTPSSVPMTTEYLTLPLVPVPIPIKVPQSAVPAAPQYPQPQNPYVNPQNPYVNPPAYGGLPQNPYGGYPPGY